MALGTSRCRLMDELEALPKSSMHGKQLLGRNLIRAGLSGRSSFLPLALFLLCKITDKAGG